MSVSRHCALYRAVDEKFYLELADEEYAGQDEAVTYGPFDTGELALAYLEGFSNPGGIDEYADTLPVPKKSPNGEPVCRPDSSSLRWGARW